MPVTIAGLGAYLPERVVKNAELEARFGLAPGWIARRTGVLERRYASERDTTVSMAVEAAQLALERAGVKLAAVDAIIGASSAPQQAIPCTAALVQRALGAPDGASACWDVNTTCLSFLFALHSAAQNIALGQYKNVLIFSSEIASPSLDPDDPQSATLFGDAAVAAVVRVSTDASAIHGARFQTFSSGASLTEIRGGGTLHRPPFAIDRPELHLFRMDGPAIFRHALTHMKAFVDSFMDGIGWQPEDLDAFVPHQASRHGVEQVHKRLGFQASQVVTNLATRGNCVAASIPLALCEAVSSGRIARGDRVVLAGTGAGLTFGALALKF